MLHCMIKPILDLESAHQAKHFERMTNRSVINLDLQTTTFDL